MSSKPLVFILLTLSLLTFVHGELVELNDQNFQSIALSKEKNVFVMFYAPWCGHCHKMMPVWKEFSSKYSLKGDTLIARLDATAYKDLAKKYKVHGFPTLRLFTKKNKTGTLEYKGNRDEEYFLKFLNANIK